MGGLSILANIIAYFPNQNVNMPYGQQSICNGKQRIWRLWHLNDFYYRRSNSHLSPCYIKDDRIRGARADHLDPSRVSSTSESDPRFSGVGSFDSSGSLPV